MGQLISTLNGWYRERIVEAIIGRVAFINTPDTIGDDFGADLLGFFKSLHPARTDMYVPSLPFHLQVKNGLARDFIAKHIHELTQLYSPFYYAVADTKVRRIDVYSGLALVAMCAYRSRAELCHEVDNGVIHIVLELSEGVQLPRWESKDVPTLVVPFHKVACLDDSTTIDSASVLNWRADCAAYMRSIASFHSGEFVVESAEGTVAQAMGFGTFCHAMSRMMHSAAMLSEEIVRGNRFAAQSSEKDATFLRTMAFVVEYLEELQCRTPYRRELEEIIDMRRWRARMELVKAIAANV